MLTQLTLAITEENTLERSFHLDIFFNGEEIVRGRVLSSEQSQDVRRVNHRYGNLFAQSYDPTIPVESQKDLGRTLFDIWLSEYWEIIKNRIPKGTLCIFLIASSSSDILNLPWELLFLPDSDFLGLNPKFSIRRMPHPVSCLPEFSGELRPKPLRLLFMASSPTDLPELDYEAEEDALLEAISGLEVAFDSGDLGTFDNLRQKITEFKPHIVHLTGHGNIQNGQGMFVFEDETGKADARSSVDIQRILGGSGVQCVFISGCKSGRTPQIQTMGGICQGLIGAEIPFTIGWAESIGDEEAIHFAQELYQVLAAGLSIDRALYLARRSLWESCKTNDDPSWSLPVLYTSHTQSEIVDPDSTRLLDIPQKISAEQKSLPGMIEGFAEHFVGRRREQQQLIPALREGQTTIVIISGLGGIGKSALATRIARKMESEGYWLIPIPSSQKNPLSSVDILQICSDIFREAARQYLARNNEIDSRYLVEAARNLEMPVNSVDARLRDVVIILNKYPFLLILDNFESSLNEETKKITNNDIANFYSYLLQHLTGRSRVIITTRYLPCDLSPLPRTAIELSLGDFSEASFIKCLRRDDKIDSRYQTGDLPHNLIHEAYHILGGTPRFIAQIRPIIANLTSDELKREIHKIILPVEGSKDEIERLREKFFEENFIPRLYSYLPSESQIALSKSSVYNIAIDLKGLSATTGFSTDELSLYVAQWHSSAFIYPESRNCGSDLWITYGLLRLWLLKQIPSLTRKLAHRSAALYLQQVFQTNRHRELGLSLVACMTESRQQFLEAEDYTNALSITEKISHILMTRGLYDSVREINFYILHFKRHPIPMIQIGTSYGYQGEYSEAYRWFDNAQKCEDIDKETTAQLLNNHGYIDYRQGRYDEAEKKYLQCLEIHKEIGNKQGQGTSLSNLASIEVKRGRYDEARRMLEKSLGLANSNPVAEASILHQLAIIDLNQGRYEQAWGSTVRSLLISQRIGDRASEAKNLNNLATIDLHLRRFDEAKRKFEQSLRIKQEIGDLDGMATTLDQLAYIELTQDRFDEAQKLSEQSLSIANTIGNPEGRARSLHNLASIAQQQNRYNEAKEKFQEVVMIYQTLGDQKGVASALHNLASIDQEMRRYKDAKEKFKKALLIRQSLGDIAGQATTFFKLSSLAWECGSRVIALRFLALCYILGESINEGDVFDDYQLLLDLASQCGFSDENIQSLIIDARNMYSKDRGKELIEGF